MLCRVDIEIGTKNSRGTYGRGLYTHLVLEDSTTLKEVFDQAEEIACVLCWTRREELVEVIINGIIRKQPILRLSA